MKTFVVGCHHRSARVEVRELVAFDASDIPRALAAFHERFPHCQAVLLSTCNRMEFWISRPAHAGPSVEEVIDFIAGFHRIDPGDFAEGLFTAEGTDAVRHLFRVASSLDSMVLGETQITHQARTACRIARDAGSIRGELDALFQRAFAVAKEIRTRTCIATGKLSVGSTAIDLARQIFSHFDDKRVMMVGAGKMGKLTLTHLLETHPKELLITNRTAARAGELAARLSQRHDVITTAVPFEQWIDRLAEVDIVITSTGSREPILTAGQFEAVAAKRRYRPILMIDIAVPRDLDPGLDAFDSVYLYNIDHLQSVVEQTLASRHEAIDECQEIIETHVVAFTQRQARRDITPIMASLEEHFKTIGDSEYQRLLPKLQSMDDHDRELIHHMLHRVTKKLLHGPMKLLNEESNNGALQAYADALRLMFELEGAEREQDKPTGGLHHGDTGSTDKGG